MVIVVVVGVVVVVVVAVLRFETTLRPTSVHLWPALGSLLTLCFARASAGYSLAEGLLLERRQTVSQSVGRWERPERATISGSRDWRLFTLHWSGSAQLHLSSKLKFDLLPSLSYSAFHWSF